MVLAVFIGYRLLTLMPYILIFTLAIFIVWKYGIKSGILSSLLKSFFSSRYVAPALAGVVFIIYIGITTNGFSYEYFRHPTDWLIVIVATAIVALLVMMITSVFTRRKSLLKTFSIYVIGSIVLFFTTSVIYTFITTQSDDKAEHHLTELANSIRAHEQEHHELPETLAELEYSQSLNFQCQTIRYSKKHRSLSLHSYAHNKPTLLYRLSFGCSGHDISKFEIRLIYVEI